jgi:hypothetical protein
MRGVNNVKIRKFLVVMLLAILLCGCSNSDLPKPEVSEGVRGDLGIDKNVNEKTIDQYLLGNLIENSLIVYGKGSMEIIKFGKKIKDDSFEVGPGAGVSYENGKYFYSYGGGTTDYWDSYRKMLDYQIEEETLTITDEAIFFYATALMDDNYSSLEKYEVSVFNYTDGTGVVDSFETENPDDINLEKKYKNKTKKFKHTFKKNESGNWYWISTEPVK